VKVGKWRDNLPRLRVFLLLLETHFTFVLARAKKCGDFGWSIKSRPRIEGHNYWI